MQRRFLLFVAASAVFMPAILLLDRGGLFPQLILGGATAAFLFAFARSSTVPPQQIGWAIVIATTGEVLLSIGWGLYSYRHALIPLYVPPGHGLFYLLAAESAQQEALRRNARAILGSVVIAGSVVAATTLVLFDDVWGLIWWIAAAAMLVRSKSGVLLPACFVYTLLLEWLGTAIGNWRWAAEVPGLGLHSANPPSGVGVLYILLDLTTVTAVAALGGAATVVNRVRSAVPAARGASPAAAMLPRDG
ncbi:MAG TPA: hypothetical protein VNA04_13735 [Thermoanaerobaculia bacterium]|nr:hypothetical protein [Thermoanaerobaculia bacterium]